MSRISGRESFAIAAGDLSTASREAAWVDCVRAGDPAAFEALFHAYHAPSDRWPDLVRTGRAVEVMGIPEFQTLYPIPQTEIDVAPGVTQNPGY